MGSGCREQRSLKKAKKKNPQKVLIMNLKINPYVG